jgi:hypothetical protein
LREKALRFIDGEVLVGSTLGYDPKRQGFFIFPADPKSNKIREYVASSVVEKSPLSIIPLHSFSITHHFPNRDSKKRTIFSYQRPEVESQTALPFLCNVSTGNHHLLGLSEGEE